MGAGRERARGVSAMLLMRGTHLRGPHGYSATVVIPMTSMRLGLVGALGWRGPLKGGWARWVSARPVSLAWFTTALLC